MAAFNAVEPEHNPTAAGNPQMYRGRKDVVDAALVRTIGSMAVCVALTYCHRHGRDTTIPDPDASFVSNVLRMMGLLDGKCGEAQPKVIKCLEKLWILYCDHELTNSTAAFLHAASTLADPISCCSGFVASGYGPLHAGAIDLAYQNFKHLGNPANVPSMIADVKAKKYRLFGYGHRIYRTIDPRVKHIKDILNEHTKGSKQDPLLEVALEIDRIASKDEYFVSRNLKANVDLYGSFAYTALYVLPMYTPHFDVRAER